MLRVRRMTGRRSLRKYGSFLPVLGGVALIASLALLVIFGSPFHRVIAAQSPSSPTSPPGVLLISLDTLRGDRVGASAEGFSLTPFLDAFSRRAAVFENAFTLANSTQLSHYTVFSGRPPSDLLTPSGQIGGPPPSVPLLAERLHGSGYRSAGFTAGGVMNKAFGLSRGFDVYQAPPEWRSLFHTIPPALEWLEKGDPARPPFLFVHGFDTHSPYLKPSPFQPPAGFIPEEEGGREVIHRWDGTLRIAAGLLFPDLPGMENLFLVQPWPCSPEGQASIRRVAATLSRSPRVLTDADQRLIRLAYDDAVRYTDFQFGRLMKRLGEKGWLDRMTVVVFSDHGEQLGEEGMFDHGYSLEDMETRVLLMVRPPGGLSRSVRVKELVDLSSVLPTLLDLSGLSLDSEVSGRSLAPSLRGWALPVQDTVVSISPHPLISARSASGRVTWQGPWMAGKMAAAWIASTPVDGPGFRHTPADLPREEALRLQRSLVDWLDRAGTGKIQPGPSPVLSPELEERLRTSGYLR